jgi:hypothetical protein
MTGLPKENTEINCSELQDSDSSEYVSGVVEPRISRYARYIVLFFLFASIASLIFQLFSGLEDGIKLTDLLEERMYYFFFIMVTLIYMALPKLIQKKMGFVADQRLVIVITLFIFAGSFLGQALSFFDRFFWWDMMLHTISGVILGLLAFALTSALNESKNATVALNPFYVAMFSFTFAVAIGGLWEIGEYLFDWILGTTMQCWNDDPSRYFTGHDYQGVAIIDTMEDMIVSTIGALVVSVVGYFYLSRGKSFMAAKKIRGSSDSENKKNEEKTKEEN